MARPEETRHLVNETTSSPEESDDRAGVTTGQQAASNDDTARTDVSPVRATGNGAGAERASDRPPRPGPTAGKGRKGARGANQATAGNGRETGSGTGPTAAGKGGEAPSPGSGSSTAGNGRPEPAAAANLDGPTARLRLPRASNGSVAANPKPAVAPAPNPDPGPASSAPTSPGTGSGGPSQPTLEPAPPQAGAPAESNDPGPAARPAPASPAGPVTGPIPAPGPAATSPPPWNRVPGRSPQPSEQPAQTQGPAGGLLDDGPTAYLMPDSGPTSDAAEPQVRSWSPMRAGRGRPPRRAALQLKRLDPWSMLKLGLVLAVVIFFIWLVAVGVLYGVLDGMGVWDRLNGTYADLVSGEAPTGSPLISAGRVFGLAAVIGAINSLLFAVAVTIGAFVYNVSADLVGGVEVTLSERD
jgi:Transmembrane domain of unknown function (DUF3566)